MEYTLAGAAQATGIAKTTIFRAIKSGKLSARRLDDRTFRIDASELARVYPIVAVERSSEPVRNVPQQEKKAGTPRASETELAVLRAKLDMMEVQLSRERDTVEDLRKRLDDEQVERRSLQRQLMPPISEKQQEAAQVAPEVETLRKRLEQAEERLLALSAQPRPTKGFLSRLFGRS